MSNEKNTEIIYRPDIYEVREELPEIADSILDDDYFCCFDYVEEHYGRTEALRYAFTLGYWFGRHGAMPEGMLS